MLFHSRLMLMQFL